MKILYDLTATQPNWNAKMHGGGNYGIAVFFALVKRNADMECAWDSTRYLDDTIQKTCEENGIKLHDVHGKIADDILRAGDFNVYYSALMPEEAHNVPNVHYLSTYHGLRSVEIQADKWALKYRQPLKWRIREYIRCAFPDRFQKRQWKKTVPYYKDTKVKFVVASEHSKYSMLSFFPFLKEDNIKVIWSPSTSVEWQGKPYSREKYIFLVSGNRSEKNALRALVAMDELFTERHELTQGLHVIVAGAVRKDYLVKFQNEDRFRFLGYVDENTLNALYCGAWLFVYPSINEGFGYPPVEAMHFGVPVIASPISSISEVCDYAALYFNPFDYHELKGRLFRMLADKACYLEYKARSQKRYAEITAKQNRDLDSLCHWIMTGGE